MIELFVVAVLLCAGTQSVDAPPSEAGELPSAIDLRPEFERLGLGPRAQGARGTCSIFTTCAAVEYALARQGGAGERLSPEFLIWAAGRAAGRPSDGNFFHNALAGFARYGLCREAALPYAPRLDPELEPSAAALAEARELRDGAGARVAVRWIVPWAPDRFGLDVAQFEAVRAVLAGGDPVAAGSSHSRLLVGYRVDQAQPGGGVFLTLDSALARFDEVSFEFVRAQVADAFWIEPQPRLDARAITLADRGRSEARIVMPLDRTPAFDYAAQELQRWLAEIGGVELPIVAEAAPPREGAAAGGGPRLLLGASEVARAQGLVAAAQALGPDGVLLRSVGDDLMLLGGGPRGQLYAVYELLELFLGCRFLAADAVVAPRREVLTVTPLDHRYAPPFAYREVLGHKLADGILAAPQRTRPRDDVVIRLCQHACYFHGIDCPALGAEYRAGLANWRAVARRVWVWHYGVNFWSYLAPNPNWAALAGDLKRYARDGIDGVMVQCDLQSRGGELAELRSYLVAQLLWDPSRDPLAIRRDFCAGYYGAAAPEALEFLAQLDAWGASLPQHVPMNGWSPPDLTPPEFVTAGLAVLDRALARPLDVPSRRHVEKLALPLWYLQLAWPERYPLPLGEQTTLLERVRRVFAEAEVTTLSEGPPNAEAFLQQVAARLDSPNSVETPGY